MKNPYIPKNDDPNNIKFRNIMAALRKLMFIKVVIPVSAVIIKTGALTNLASIAA